MPRNIVPMTHFLQPESFFVCNIIELKFNTLLLVITDFTVTY